MQVAACCYARAFYKRVNQFIGLMWPQCVFVCLFHPRRVFFALRGAFDDVVYSLHQGSTIEQWGPLLHSFPECGQLLARHEKHEDGKEKKTRDGRQR